LCDVPCRGKIRIILIFRRAVRALLTVLALLLTACDTGGKTTAPTAVASFFPMAEVARALYPGQVVDITPPGVEPHDVELAAKQIDRIQDADAVILLGGGFQPAIERAAKRSDGTVITIDPKGDDPHIWLDPVRMQDVARQVATALHRDPSAFVVDLIRLDEQFQAGLKDCDRRTLVTAHDAFGHLARRYSLQTAALTGISPEAEPNPQRMAEVADLVRRTGTTTVFTEELVSPKVADALAREAGVRTDVLDTLESGTPGTYFDVMRANLAKLRAALGCR
jgi:zinc transport system substrate-binding protein